MKYTLVALAALVSSSSYAADSFNPEAYPVVLNIPQYSEKCHGDKQPVWCAEARDDANVKGSTGGSDSPSDSENK
jgi:hypothetical protein